MPHLYANGNTIWCLHLNLTVSGEGGAPHLTQALIAKKFQVPDCTLHASSVYKWKFHLVSSLELNSLR